MTDIVIVPAAPVVPPFPALGAPDFNQLAYNFGVAMPDASDGVRAVAVTTHTNATVAQERATAAAASATTATTQADLAMGYRNTAGSHATTATDQAGIATTKASEAAASAVQASKLNLGNKSTEPATDNQGDPLLGGATYYDTTLDKWRVWTGSAWGDGISTVAGVSSLDGQAGPLTLKMINGIPLLGAGNIEVGASLYRVARTTNTALAATDKGKLIDITSGTFAQTFAAAATLGDGWWCYLRNSGTGDITLDPDGAEQIDGLTSYVMYPGEMRLVQCDGLALRTVVLSSFYKAFTSSGTFTKPPGYSCFGGRLWGGGNSGARSGASGAGVYGGGGGGCGDFMVPASAVGATETATVGAGGAAYTGSDAGGGNGGGNSSFGSFITVYKGNTNATGGSIVQFLAAAASASPVGHEGGQKGATTTENLSGVWGGGGSSNALNSGSSVYGGAAGGSITSANAILLAGTSRMGGNGGAASANTNGVAGLAPGGGGGATQTGTSAGAGARGEVRIWGVI